jgi:3-hydroxypropanoate dehydrogenase
MRLVFVKSKEAKERLKPTLSSGNVEQTMTAPVCAIVAQDSRFYELMPKLAPHNPTMGERFAKPEKAESTREHAFRNSSLQGAYLILAARALGLDAGPMSGFDNEKLDAEFFPDGRYKSNFLLNLGYGDASKLHPRAPRPEFEEACKIL